MLRKKKKTLFPVFASLFLRKYWFIIQLSFDLFHQVFNIFWTETSIDFLIDVPSVHVYSYLCCLCFTFLFLLQLVTYVSLYHCPPCKTGLQDLFEHNQYAHRLSLNVTLKFPGQQKLVWAIRYSIMFIWSDYNCIHILHLSKFSFPIILMWVTHEWHR